MSVSEILKTALEQIQFLAKTDTIVGEPIQAGTVVLIPISRVSVGFAAGGADKEKSSGSGSGTGGGVNVVPIALISVHEGKVQVHHLDKMDVSLSKVLAMAPDLLQKVTSFMDKKKKKNNE